MKMLRPAIVAVGLSIMVSSTALAGNIGGLRTTGNIGGMRAAGNIGGMRAAGNIGGMRTANAAEHDRTLPSINSQRSRFDSEGPFSAPFTTLIRMLLESGTLL